jgi:AcrR family transcriptional regulator
VTDPRIKRTRLHILETARVMLDSPASEPVTISTLARAAEVSRRTIYIHWESVEQLIAEATANTAVLPIVGDFDGSLQERLFTFLYDTRALLRTRLPRIAVSSVAYFAANDSVHNEQLRELHQRRLSQFRAAVGDISEQQFGLIVGPVYFAALVAGEPISDDAIARQVASALELLTGNKSSGSRA